MLQGIKQEFTQINVAWCDIPHSDVEKKVLNSINVFSYQNLL